MMPGMRFALVGAWFGLLAAPACDSRARATDSQVRPESKSREYESCGASLHCQDELRCFDGICRRGERSTVGDYHAALGAHLRGRGEHEAALDAYNRALGHYDTEKIALPPDIDCAYGASLAAAKAKKEHAELAARVLHRCVLAVPVGSSLRTRALADLATIADTGLDPLALGRAQLADVYLTRAPKAPATDKLVITVTANPQPTGKTYPNLPARLGEADVRPALVACWEAYNAATRKDAMAVSFGLKSQYLPPEYDDEPGRYTVKVDPPTALPPGPDGAAEQCVRAVVEPALKALTTVRESFTTKLTITVK
jgi:hypothetical protein